MEKVALSLSPGSLVTILGLLKNFYDAEIFSELIKEYYNTDTTVSVAAVRASASLGNEVSIPHLYKILEKGNNEQQLAAIDALAEIRAPSSVDVLYKNFNTLAAQPSACGQYPPVSGFTGKRGQGTSGSGGYRRDQKDRPG
ncbi:MAG: HEAT repeat domain-containing protein [Spirochaetia bacterium]